MTVEEEQQARARLRIYYGIDNPSKREVKAYYMFGDNATFLKYREARAAGINISSGGPVKMDLNYIYVQIKGTNKLLSLICDEMATEATPKDGDRLAALMSIEKAFVDIEKNVEILINK